jgi:MFS family permease
MSGFAYGNLLITLSLMNGLAPIVAPVTKGQMIDLGRWIVIVNMVLMPFFGWLCTRVGRDRLMLTASILLAVYAPLSFSYLAGASLNGVVLIRMGLLTLGSAITAPYYFWMKEIAPAECRFTFIGLAKAAGLQLIGAPAGAIVLWLYHSTGSLPTAALYFSFLALSAATAVTLGPRLKAAPFRVT